MPSLAVPPPEYREQIREQIFDTFDRTSSDMVHMIFARESERITRSQTTSQLLTNASTLNEWIASLPKLMELSDNWSREGSPAPNKVAIEGAREFLRAIRFSPSMPEKVHPSAEGGVAIVYVGAGKNRAIVESLNNQEQYILLYDLDGGAVTLDWSRDVQAQEPLIKQLESHLQGTHLDATHG